MERLQMKKNTLNAMQAPSIKSDKTNVSSYNS